MAKNRKTIVSVTFIVALLLCAIICGACAAGKTEPEENTSVPEQTTGAKKDDTAPEATASSTEEQAISVSYQDASRTAERLIRCEVNDFGKGTLAQDVPSELRDYIAVYFNTLNNPDPSAAYSFIKPAVQDRWKDSFTALHTLQTQTLDHPDLAEDGVAYLTNIICMEDDHVYLNVLYQGILHFIHLVKGSEERITEEDEVMWQDQGTDTYRYLDESNQPVYVGGNEDRITAFLRDAYRLYLKNHPLDQNLLKLAQEKTAEKLVNPPYIGAYSMTECGLTAAEREELRNRLVIHYDEAKSEQVLLYLMKAWPYVSLSSCQAIFAVCVDGTEAGKYLSSLPDHKDQLSVPRQTVFVCFVQQDGQYLIDNYASLRDLTEFWR